MEKKSSKGLVLKEFPKHLKYVFLDKDRSKPVIIAANLIAEIAKSSGNSQKT